MALDKLVDSAWLDMHLTGLATIIRNKTGETEPLSFPDGMELALARIVPAPKHNVTYYVKGVSLTPTPATLYYSGNYHGRMAMPLQSQTQNILVEMGGVDITSSAYSVEPPLAHIDIPFVSGDINIQVVRYTNLLPTAWYPSVNTIYNGKGWKEDVRLAISGGGAMASSGSYTTGLIPVSRNDVIRFGNTDFGKTGYSSTITGYNGFCVYDATPHYINGVGHSDMNKLTVTRDADNNITSMVMTVDGWSDSQLDSIAYVRFTMSRIRSTSIITVNEEIS